MNFKGKLPKVSHIHTKQPEEIQRYQEQQESRHRTADSKLLHCEMLPTPFSDIQLGVNNSIYVDLFPHKQVYKPRGLNLRYVTQKSFKLVIAITRTQVINCKREIFLFKSLTLYTKIGVLY